MEEKFSAKLPALLQLLAPVSSCSVLTTSQGAAVPQVAHFLEMSSFIISKYC